MQQAKGSMNETRLKIRTKTYLEETLATLSLDGAPPLSQLMQEEIELAYERGYKDGDVDATRKESSQLSIETNSRVH